MVDAETGGAAVPDARPGVDVFEGLTKIGDLLNAGEGGLTLLQRTVDLTLRATAAAGAAFIEYGATGGRVVAAAGALTWSLGLPIDLPDQAVIMMKAQARDRVREFPTSAVDAESGKHLTGLGMHRLMATTAMSGPLPLGVLGVCFPDEDGKASPEARSALVFLADFVAMQYGLGRGLPVYEDGPSLSGGDEAVALLGPDHVVRYWNPAAALLTARAIDDAIGRPWPFPLPAGDEVVEHQMACGTWIEIRAFPMPRSDAITVRFHARREPPTDERDLFIALTGHELRTPVTVIRGYADTLAEHWDFLDEDARREAVFVVGQRARELARLVDRLLNAVSDDRPLADAASVVPFDLVDALHTATDELTADLRRSLKVALPAALPKALGDRASLATVLTELTTNAGKYSPNWVEVELTAGSDAQTVWFRVADRGVGIRPEHVERAFERFWQLETGDQRAYGGVGLGLYLVRRIIERQHGWVSLRPREGGGTVAEVRLPRADASHGEA
jgi:two-component system, OmpR family, phosphate regulon sensor histidine kinase PhoR